MSLIDIGAPLFDEEASTRKSANHGEAGYARQSRDFYPTERWVTEALIEAVDFTPNTVPPTPRAVTVIWEPACGDGAMFRPLWAAGYYVAASDIHDYGMPCTVIGDFIRDPIWEAIRKAHGEIYSDDVHAVVTNPPFDIAREFVRKACHVTYRTRGKVAILQRHEFDAPKSNRPLFTELPFAQKLILPRRPRWSDSDKASPRFPYAWYVWDWRHSGPPVIRWIDEPTGEGPGSPHARRRGGNDPSR